MKRFAALGCIVFCALAPFSAAQTAADVPGPGAAAESGPSSSAEGPEESGSDLTELSIVLLLEAAGGSHAAWRWRPGWPPDLPPDLFYIPGALSVRVDFDGGKLELVMEGERFRAFPVLTRTGLIQGRCEYDGGGRLIRLSWESGGGAMAGRRRTVGDADAGRGWGEGDAEVVERDGGGQPVLWRIFSGAYYFAALEYNGAAAFETWYDEGGKALFALESGPRGTTRIFPPGGGPAAGPATVVTTIDYNNGGLVSAVTGNGETVSALYNFRNMPRYLEISRDGAGQNPDENADRNPDEDQDTKPLREFYVYQWDETGRLIRLSGGPDGGLDYRYEYTLDDRGNWTERRELRMETIGPGEGEGPEARLVPAAVRTIRRTIRYAGSRSGEK
ncbi:MAG: hypothetical protein LBK74_07085 [Treponema sp.]|jgi:hypothetical protein|nr:hypothetical protein [Treponema sp.]